MAKHILSMLVENNAGVLSRISGLFSRRGFNIDSLTVGVTQDPGMSRMTIVLDGNEYDIDQLGKQVNKLHEVKKTRELQKGNSVVRELALIKVNASAAVRSEVVAINEIFRGRIVDVTIDTLTIETSGPTDKIDALVAMLQDFGIKEMVRTGAIAMERGSHVFTMKNHEEEE